VTVENKLALSSNAPHEVLLTPVEQKSQTNQKLFLRLFLLSMILPEFLDFALFGSTAARLARIGLVSLALLQQLAAHNKQAPMNRTKRRSVGLYACLVVVGVVTALLNQGLFPIYMVSALLWLLMIARQDDSPNAHLEQVFRAAQALTLLSTGAILLRLPSPFAFSQSDSTNYFVPLNNLLGLSGRQAGVLSHANQLAPICVIAIIGALISKRNQMLIPVYVFTLLTTGSNTSYISGLLGVTFVYVGGSKFAQRATRDILRVSGAVIIGATVALLIGSFTIDITQRFLTGRGFIWTQTLSLLKGHWLLGLGWQFERPAILQGLLPPFAASVHNTYLEWLSNYGLIGFMLILPLFVTFASNLSSPIPQRRALAATLLVFSFSESLINLGLFSLIAYIFIFLTWNAKEAPPGELGSIEEPMPVIRQRPNLTSIRQR